MINLDAIFGPEAPSQMNGTNGKTAQPEALADRDLAEVLALIEQIRAVRPFVFLDDLAALARGYHQRGERELLAAAVFTTWRVLCDSREKVQDAGCSEDASVRPLGTVAPPSTR